MEPISEELVNETWQEVAGFTPNRARKEMTKLGKDQPDLLAFITEFTKDMNQEVKELTIYMFFNIYRMFQKSSKEKIKPISSKKIIKCFENNENFMEGLEGAHYKFFEKVVKVQLSRQPYVMKYLVETLFETPEEDSIALTEEDMGYLFLLLKTVIDVLDMETNVRKNRDTSHFS
ncbi:MAG TPA: hypothetical protein EYP21_10875 [Syntrophaceae bacterium]|nr:hypothetical protein [Syntrophaceae bacterium]